MLRERDRSLLSLLFVLGCGARTELFIGSDSSPSTQLAVGGGSALPTAVPVSTRCELVGDDPRVAGIEPDQIASLDGADFVVGDVTSYHWTLQTEDCDAVVKNAQFTLQGVDSRVVKFQPSRPALYHFTLDVRGAAGDQASCKLAVPVRGVGMRVELCWDTSTSTDLDLYLHTPFDQNPWFTPGSVNLANALNDTTCNTSNATALLRDLPRLNWGYDDSGLGACNTPSFEGFLSLGRCPNPRAANDNNQSIATGTTERIQLDNPRAGQSFRVMVQNYNNRPALPHVFVYCGGQRAGAFDGPATLGHFVAANSGIYGAMWRVADISTDVAASGTVICRALPVTDRAFTVNDPSF